MKPIPDLLPTKPVFLFLIIICSSDFIPLQGKTGTAKKAHRVVSEVAVYNIQNVHCTVGI